MSEWTSGAVARITTNTIADTSAVSAQTYIQPEADLGMFSMFGRTGAPTNRGPPQKDQKLFFFSYFAT